MLQLLEVEVIMLSFNEWQAKITEAAVLDPNIQKVYGMIKMALSSFHQANHGGKPGYGQPMADQKDERQHIQSIYALFNGAYNALYKYLQTNPQAASMVAQNQQGIQQLQQFAQTYQQTNLGSHDERNYLGGAANKLAKLMQGGQ